MVLSFLPVRFMQVVLGSDHAGFNLKKELHPLVQEHADQLIDVGTDSSSSVDYPDFAEALAEKIRSGEADRGILICGSGIGASVAANKIPGIRAGLCHDTYTARQAVEHDDINVLVLGARVIGIEVAREVTRAFLAAEYSGSERHERRLRKVKELEDKACSK